MHSGNYRLQGNQSVVKKKVFINIGGSFASKDPVIISTLLGSCVAVCLFDPVTRVGGMNHILLPGKSDIKKFNDTARYGVHAMELLITQMMKLRVKRSRIVAKAFGGANVMQGHFLDVGIGLENAKFVVKFLKNENIKLFSRDLGGHNIRRIYFHTDTGDVFLQRIQSKASLDIFKTERKHLDVVRKKIKKPGDVTIFKSNTHFKK
jgi:chemotaxis protein CheD